MKVVLDKRLESGKYYVRINISEYTPEEVEKIKVFGAPMISISPKRLFLNGRFVSDLPLHSMNFDFDFDTEAQANSFVTGMTQKIKDAVETLKARKDQFSGKDELNL